MKRRDPESVSEIIDRAVAQAGLTETMACQRACYLWPEVVGPGINRYTPDAMSTGVCSMCSSIRPHCAMS